MTIRDGAYLAALCISFLALGALLVWAINSVGKLPWKRFWAWFKPQWWSWFLPAFGLLYSWLLGTHYWGWLVGIVWEGFWVIYALTLRPRQWGFFFTAFAYAAIFARNYLVAAGLVHFLG